MHGSLWSRADSRTTEESAEYRLARSGRIASWRPM
jgi:hypothetical protein